MTLQIFQDFAHGFVVYYYTRPKGRAY